MKYHLSALTVIILCVTLNAQYVQQSQLVATGIINEAQFGHSVSVSSDGNTIIVGGQEDNYSHGAAWVFIKQNDQWFQQAKLIGTDGYEQGRSVSLSADGNTAIVGGHGASWIFIRQDGQWTQQAQLVGTDAVGDAYQGYSVSISSDGNTAIVGGWGDNGSIGAAWIFIRQNGQWIQQGDKLVGTGAIGNAEQGYSASISSDGNTVAVGGHLDNNWQGAAWVYTRQDGQWTQQAKLVGTGVVGFARQGCSVSVSGDGNTIIMGGDGDNRKIGAAWIFKRQNGKWTQEVKLIGTGEIGGAHQGMAVSISPDGNAVIVGGYIDNDSQGAAWIFQKQNDQWIQLGDKLVGTGTGVYGWQGYSVSMSYNGNTAIVCGIGPKAAWVFNKSKFSISSTATEGGTISPTGNVDVYYGENKTFKITPSPGYHTKTVMVDFMQVYDSLSGYTFTNVERNHIIEVTFAKNVPPHALPGCHITSFAVNGPNLFAGSWEGVFMSTNNGESWTKTSSGLMDKTVFSLGVSQSSLFAGVFAGNTGDGAFLSSNNGSSWTSVSNGLLENSVFAFAVNGPNIYAGTWGGGVFLSTNNGANWNQLNIGNRFGHISSFAINKEYLFAADDGTGILLSTDNGASWKYVNNGLTTLYFSALAVSGQNVFAGSNWGVFVSTDNGQSWNKVSNGFKDYYVRALAVCGSKIFAGTTGGVYVSDNNGESWELLNDELYDVDIKALAVSGAYLYVGTYENGFFRYNINGYTITASAGQNGSITPTGGIIVPSGCNQTFRISANAGYHTSQLKVDGSPIKDSLTTYTFQNVTANHTIEASFAINPSSDLPAPTLSYPTGGIPVYTNSPLIIWYINKYVDGAKYHLQISETPDFKSPCFQKDNITGLQSEAPALKGGKTYYARVRLKSPDCNYSQYSAAGSFNVIASGTEPVKPILAYPTSGITVYEPSPAITWYINQWAPPLKYHLQLSLTDDFANPVVDASDITAFSYMVSGLSAGAAYYSRVRSFTSDGIYSEYSNTGYFTVDNNNGTRALTPVLVYPTGGITVYTASPVLNWYVKGYAPLQKYNLQVSTRADFTALVLDQDDIPSVQYQLTGLTNGVTYFIRVRGKAADGTYSLFSPAGSFTVWAGGYPVVPAAASPNGSVKLQSSVAVLTWYLPSKSAARQKYDLQISTDMSFADNIQIPDIDTTSYSINNLKGETKYYWRVRSRTSDGKASQYSNEGTFITSKLSGTAMEPVSPVPEEYELKQNYPNPFNPVTTISYSLKEAGSVKLSVFDALCKRVAVIVDEYKSAGSYSIKFDASTLPSGVYLYRLEAGRFSTTKKLILMK